MKQTSLSLLFLLLTTIAVKAQFTFTNYTDHTELAPQRVRSLLEGNDGLMWLATYNGLYSFDGYQFYNFKARPGDGNAMESDYLKLLRMRRSAELLRNSDIPVSDIAFCVGIPDSHYFSKCFRQYFNMTPSEYRTNPRPTNG